MARALDTVEDDTKAFNGNSKIKKDYLRQFYKNFNNLYDVGEEIYRPLLINYDKLETIFATLSPNSQTIIKTIIRKMGKGMSKYVDRSIDSMEEYNEYCYYVAGLVGIGLTQLFREHNAIRIDPESIKHHNLGINTGLFLQKTNIIRDYKEDLDEGIQWYPKEIWIKYKSKFTDFNGDIPSRNCLNELITDALQHIPDVFLCQEIVTNADVFKCGAIPPIMAIATLQELYDNPQVFHTNVKIRKGLALHIMVKSNNMGDMYYWFHLFSKQIKAKIRIDDPNAEKTHEICDKIISKSAPLAAKNNLMNYILILCLIIIVLLIMAGLYFKNILQGNKDPITPFILPSG